MIYHHDFGRGTEQLTPVSPPKDKKGITFAVTLMVGFCATVEQAAALTVDENTVHLTSQNFLTLTPDAFAKLSARLVLTPLVDRGHDAVEYALRLQYLGFSGRYHALVRQLPDIGIVANEVQEAAPQVDFNVTELGSAQAETCMASL